LFQPDFKVDSLSKRDLEGNGPELKTTAVPTSGRDINCGWYLASNGMRIGLVAKGKGKVVPVLL